MRTCYVSQGAPLNALRRPEWKGSPKEGGHVYGELIHFTVQQTLT